MRRTFIAAALAIAVVFAGGVALVDVLSGALPPVAQRDPVPPAAAPVSSAPVPAASPPAAAPVPAPAPAPAREVRGTKRDSGTAHAGWGRRPGTAPSTPTADRVTRKQVRAALLAGSIRSRLAGCVDRGGFGGPPSPGPVPGATPAVLLLELEATATELRIVDATVREWGAASSASIACARAVLRGQTVPGRTPGRAERTSMPFPLSVGPDSVASR